MSDASADLTAASFFEQIMKSQETGDYALFSSVMDETMKKVITPERFKGVCERMASYFQVSYDSQYMGGLRAGTHTIHFWKVSVAGKANDLLVRVGIKDGRVSGLLFTPPFDTAIQRPKDKDCKDKD